MTLDEANAIAATENRATLTDNVAKPMNASYTSDISCLVFVGGALLAILQPHTRSNLDITTAMKDMEDFTYPGVCKRRLGVDLSGVATNLMTATLFLFFYIDSTCLLVRV